MIAAVSPDEHFNAFIGGLNTTGPVLLAVSGGSDSLALMHIAARSKIKHRFHIVTVDHKLRPEAAAEAEFVSQTASALGLPHTTLTIDWASNEHQSQSSARQKRYAALANLARKVGAKIVLTGHTLSDQAETFLMRAASSSRAWGLGCMEPLTPIPVWPEGRDLWIGRPFLDVTRTQLRDWLEGNGVQDWFNDPSNSAHHYERVRVRALIKQSPSLLPQISRLQKRFALLRSLSKQQLILFLRRHSRWLPGNSLELDRRAYFSLAENLQIRLLLEALPCVYGHAKIVEIDKGFLLQKKIQSLQSASLGHCVVETNAQTILITPEKTEPTPSYLASGPAVFVNRTLVETEDPIRIDFLEERPRGPAAELAASLPSKARSVLPVMLDDQDQVIAPLHNNETISVTDLGQMRLERRLGACDIWNMDEGSRFPDTYPLH